MKYFFTTIFLSCFICNGFSQTLLQRKLNGIDNFFEIMEIVETHYDSLRKLGIEYLPGDKKYKHWKRWEWYMSQFLDENGKIADIGRTMAREAARLDKRENALAQSRFSTPLWDFIGPSSSNTGDIDAPFLGLGRVDRIAFHPTNGNIIYIGTPGGGVWKTTNGGSTWTSMTDFLPSIGIAGIVIHPLYHNTVYILTGDGDSNLNTSSGIYRSTDGGATWQHLSEITSSAFRGYKLRINPDDPSELWAATTVGLYRSQDGGYTWTQRVGGVVCDVVLHPTNPDIVYGCTWFTTFRSTNGGNSFTSPGFDVIPAAGRKALAVSLANPSVVYLLCGPQTGGGSFNGFYRSTDSGANFTRQTTTPNLFGRTGSDDNDQSNYDIAIAASLTNSNLVYTGGLIIFKTTNGGTSFNAITSFSEDGSPWYVHPDVHAIEINPVDGALYAGTDGGFYKSTDNGSTWTDLSEGIETTMFYNLAGYRNDAQYLLGGSQDNGVKHRKNNTTNFVHVDCCDGFDTAFDPNSSDLMYASLNNWLSRYTSNGNVKTDITPKGHWFMRVAAHPAISDLVFAGTTDRMYKSFNAGNTWDTIFIEANDQIMLCPSNASRMYIAGASGGTVRLNRTDNLGATFDRLDDNPGFPSGVFIRGIAVHPSNSNRVWVSFVGVVDGVKVFYSDDAGASWENWSFGLPNVPCNNIAVRANGDLFAATTIGVFYKPSGYADWIPINNGLPRCMMTEFVINESAGLIRVGTYGRGVWEASIPDGTCTPNLVWNSNQSIDGYRYYEADNTITTNFHLIGGANTTVNMKAGNLIEMNPGFEVPADGSFYNATIGPCAEGGIPDGD